MDEYFSYGTTILMGLNQTMPTHCNVEFLPVLQSTPGLNFVDKPWVFIDDSSLSEAVAAAALATHVVVAIGEETYTEKPGDIDELTLDSPQLQLMEAINAVAVPGGVVNVLVEGRPRSFDGLIERLNRNNAAIILAFLPGPDGGQGIAEVLFGEVNPSGRLPITYPKSPNNCMPYWHKASEKETFRPQWEFGHGLSYTAWSYTNLALSVDTLEVESLEDITVSVQLRNAGGRDGKHTVLMFVSDEFRSITPEVKRLKGFEKVEVAAGSSVEVTFRLTPKDLGFFNIDNVAVVEPGTFIISIGGESVTLAVTGEGHVCLDPVPPVSSDDDESVLTTAGIVGVAVGSTLGVGLAATVGYKAMHMRKAGAGDDSQPLIKEGVA